eukprot:gene23644-biopygen1279
MARAWRGHVLFPPGAGVRQSGFPSSSAVSEGAASPHAPPPRHFLRARSYLHRSDSKGSPAVSAVQCSSERLRMSILSSHDVAALHPTDSASLCPSPPSAASGRDWEPPASPPPTPAASGPSHGTAYRPLTNSHSSAAGFLCHQVFPFMGGGWKCRAVGRGCGRRTDAPLPWRGAPWSSFRIRWLA